MVKTHTIQRMAVLVLLLGASFALSLGVIVAVGPGGDSDIPRGTGIVGVPSVGEAEELAGFAALRYDPPADATRLGVAASSPSAGDGIGQILESWRVGDGTLFILQSPQLTRVLGDVQSDPQNLVIDDRAFALIRHPVTDFRPHEIVVVHWMEGGLGVAVVGVLGDGLTVGELVAVATSAHAR